MRIVRHVVFCSEPYLHCAMMFCRFLCPSAFALAVCLMLYFAGCKSSGGSGISHPFAMDRQTVPPPATFSYQAAYLGQTPDTYNPQQPATPFPSAQSSTLSPSALPSAQPGTVTPASSPALESIPAGVPLPSSSPLQPANPSGATTYGSLNTPVAQTASSATPVAAEWQSPSAVPHSAHASVYSPTPAMISEKPVDATATPQTMTQYMDSKVGTVAMPTPSGTGQAVTAAPETQVVSSSQAMTRISEATPSAVPQAPSQSSVESRTLYSPWQ